LKGSYSLSWGRKKNLSEKKEDEGVAQHSPTRLSYAIMAGEQSVEKGRSESKVK